MFPAPQTRIGTVVIPPGKRALALQLEPVPGVAGFVGAGDLVDVYGVCRVPRPARPGSSWCSSRWRSSTSTAPASRRQGMADGPNLVYLVAVTPADAERLIFISEFNKLYFDLVAKGEPPVVTPGAGAGEALKGV